MGESLKTRATLLCRLADQHDEESWEEFVSYYREFIYLVIRGMQISHHDAEELTQDILLRLWDKLPEFRYSPEKGRFRGWLCLITGNLVKDFIRRRKLYAEKLDSIGATEQLNYLSRINIPEIDRIAKKEWENYITVIAWKTVQQHFSETVCQAFLMLRQGMSRKEVAEKLDLAETTISTYKARIVDRIQKEVKRLDEELSGI